MLNGAHDSLALEEAILGIIGSMDKPGSPAGEAKKHFHETLFGRTREHRALFRAGVVGTTLDDLHRVASTYLTDSEASSIAIVTNAQLAEDNHSLLDELGLCRRELL